MEVELDKLRVELRKAEEDLETLRRVVQFLEQNYGVNNIPLSKAIESVLQDTGRPMSHSEIAVELRRRGLRHTHAIYNSLKRGDQFQKTEQKTWVLTQ